MQYDIFNGDADGICALIQLRLNNPVQDAVLITGIKRHINLLDDLCVTACDTVTVLDVSLKKNADGLTHILNQGAYVFYVDHHEPGVIPKHPNLKTLINTAPDTCTGLIVDTFLEGKHREWAITAAYGDNLIGPAEQLSKAMALTYDQSALLKTLGTCINYNSYGDDLSDLRIEPRHLYLQLCQYRSPFDFILDNKLIYDVLLAGYQNDLNETVLIKPDYETNNVCVYILPDTPGSRRISGVFSNNLAHESPKKAHAVLTYNKQGDFKVSVRAPLNNPVGADELCALFPTGGGRKRAAGINHLPLDQLATFIAQFEKNIPKY